MNELCITVIDNMECVEVAADSMHMPWIGHKAVQKPICVRCRFAITDKRKARDHGPKGWTYFGKSKTVGRRWQVSVQHVGAQVHAWPALGGKVANYGQPRFHCCRSMTSIMIRSRRSARRS